MCQALGAKNTKEQDMVSHPEVHSPGQASLSAAHECYLCPISSLYAGEMDTLEINNFKQHIYIKFLSMIVQFSLNFGVEFPMECVATSN